jgi:hypothetical protein
MIIQSNSKWEWVLVVLYLAEIATIPFLAFHYMIPFLVVSALNILYRLVIKPVWP